ncbi:MAG TPA: helix-turn-helix domain-containing protein [Longimicrobiales bacterium]|nr:helix-turn-helix domain-containing protein [Longimicrobiales bacterium]
MTGHDEWLNAAAAALVRGGVESVKVEALARELGVTKGSFYWHFADRGALLEAVLARWETGAQGSLEAAATGAAPAQRVSALLRSMARGGGGVNDTEVFAWARRERAVAERVAVVERARVVFLKEQLGSLGVPLMDAHRRAEAAYLAAAAWLERASRTPWMKSDYGAFMEDVLRLLLRSSEAAAQ